MTYYNEYSTRQGHVKLLGVIGTESSLFRDLGKAGGIQTRGRPPNCSPTG